MRSPLIGLAAVLVGAVSCSEVEQPGTTFATGSLLDSADQVAFGSRTLVTDGGLLRAEIFADTTLFLDQNTRIAMRVVHGDFFNGWSVARLQFLVNTCLNALVRCPA